MKLNLNEKINYIREQISEEVNPINTTAILNNVNIAPKLEVQKIIKIYSPIFRYLVTTILIIAIIIPLSIYQLNQPKNNDSTMITSVYNYNEKVYGYAITSTIALIDSTDDIFNDISSSIPNNDIKVYSEINSLNHFLQPIEMMLLHNKSFYKIETSEKIQYTKKISYTGLDLHGENLKYEIYYNEKTINESTQVIDFIVNVGNETFSFTGQNHKINNKTIFQLTYLIDQDNTKDYIQVTKNLSEFNDSFDYSFVKNDIIISKNRLTLFNEHQIYASLVNIISSTQSTTFKIYPSSPNKFLVDYTISLFIKDKNNENINETDKESGNIIIDINNESISYYFISDNLKFTFKNKSKN